MPGTDMIEGGGPAFSWCKLDINRGPALPREADKVVRLFKSLTSKFETARTREDKETLLEAMDSLRMSIEGRIDELEKFYMQNDVDERAVLFEKQRLALRRLLQTDPHAQNAASYAAQPPLPPARARPTDDGGDDQNRIDRVRHKLENMPKQIAAMNRLMKGKNQPKLAYSTNASPKKNFNKTLRSRRSNTYSVQASDGTLAAIARRLQVPVGQLMELNLPRKLHPTSMLHAGTVLKVQKKAVAPIYAWEKKGSKPKQTEQPQTEVTEKIFGPVEFQIRLTEKEFFKFTSRRRGMAAAKRHKERFKRDTTGESPFLQSTGPYVDPQRVKNSIFRSPDKSKWMDEKGIRPYAHQ